MKEITWNCQESQAPIVQFVSSSLLTQSLSPSQRHELGMQEVSHLNSSGLQVVFFAGTGQFSSSELSLQSFSESHL